MTTRSSALFPTTLDEASSAAVTLAAISEPVELRAGGTDLQERRRTGTSTGTIIDLTRIAELASAGIHRNGDGTTTIGAATTIAELATDPETTSRYAGLAATAGGLATPQIRAVGTVGGNLAQRTRCWYYRSGHRACLKLGGDRCGARDGNHLYHAVIDQGPCVAPHPSSIGMALLAYDATVTIHQHGDRPVHELWGNGTDPTRDHLLAPGEIITAVNLPPPWPAEHAAYHRTITRFEAEWPLVEAIARLDIDTEHGLIERAAIGVGGVANTPLRLHEVEAVLVGQPPRPDVLADASHAADHRCQPLPQTTYKQALLPATLRETLERATATTHR